MRDYHGMSEAQFNQRIWSHKIRRLCGIYAQALCLERDALTSDEAQMICTIVDDALVRLRGVSETDKRARERAEYQQRLEKEDGTSSASA